MGYESNTGLNVNQHYGARPAGGTEGVIKTEGHVDVFMQDLDVDGIDFGFQVTDGSAWVTEADVSQAGGTITAITIGGVDVIAATSEVPVQVPADNTGVVVLTGGDSTGKYTISYKKYPL